MAEKYEYLIMNNLKHKQINKFVEDGWCLFAIGHNEITNAVVYYFRRPLPDLTTKEHNPNKLVPYFLEVNTIFISPEDAEKLTKEYDNG